MISLTRDFHLYHKIVQSYNKKAAVRFRMAAISSHMKIILLFSDMFQIVCSAKLCITLIGRTFADNSDDISFFYIERRK